MTSKPFIAHRPGESSSTFSLRPEFFSYGSHFGDDYIDMDTDEADDIRVQPRDRYEGNVFEEVCIREI